MFKGMRIDSLLVYTILFSSIIILADLTGYLALVKRFRAFVTYPIQLSVYSVKNVNTGFFSIFTQKSLLQENNALKQKNLALESKISAIEQDKLLVAEFAKNKPLLPAREYKRTVNALIIDENYNNSEGVLLLSKGQKDGVAVGMPVVIGNSYIGFITEVTEYSSVCVSFVQPGQQFIGYILNRKVSASIRTTQAKLQLFDLLATDTIALKDIISIRREGFPYYFTLASITKLPEKTGSAERIAIIESAFSLSKLNSVTIVQE